MELARIAEPAAVVVAVGVAGIVWLGRRIHRREVERLAATLGWREGASVADVGAGSGSFVIPASQRVGLSGRIFASEIDRKKIARLRRRARQSRSGNITVVTASEDRSGLTPGCCDAILVRGSYHHFTKPESMTADLFQALRTGGVLAAVDFRPRWWLTLVSPVKGVPANRGGHGIPRPVLVEEMTAAGFELRKEIPRWAPGLYCVVFRKPG
jgi:ubiquinone/menaquinone biosynthesis C-methylase UbiE